jgi:lysophospholipase L1-like esterase
MNKKIKLPLIISLIVNFIFILSVGYVIHKKGGISWVHTKVEAVLNRNKVTENYSTPYYLTKKSIFESEKENQNAIVFLGDSLTDNYDWCEEFQNYNIQNRGISSDTTDGVLNRLDSIINEKPKKIFLMIGINDLGNGKQNDYIINNYNIILEKIKKGSPDTIIYIESILPVNKSLSGSAMADNNKIIDLNKKLQQLQSNNVIYINIFNSLTTNDNELNKDLTYDGVHLNGQGYGIWVNIIKDYVQ